MLVTYLIKCKLILEGIHKLAQQSERKMVEKSARQAVDLLSDMVCHVEKYLKDSQNLSDIKELRNSISFGPVKIGSYGFLKATVEVKKLKIMNLDNEYTNVTMLCFENKILFYYQESEESTRKCIKTLKIFDLHISHQR